MSEEQIMLKLEMYLSFCQNNCIEHNFPSAINIISPLVCVPITQEVLKISQYDFRF